MAKKSESTVTSDKIKDEKTSTKAAVKKTTTKKTAAKKVDAEVIFQYAGKEIFPKALLEEAKKDFKSNYGKESDIKDMKLYIKPEDHAAYYVVNESISGKISFS